MARRLVGLSVLALTLALASPSHATPINGGFETGSFAGWTTIGTTSVAGSFAGILPPAGAFQASATSTGATTVQLETFFGLAAGTIDAAVGVAANGAGFQQTFSVLAGEVYAFRWNFLSNEFPNDPSFNDTAFIVLNGAITELADTFTPGSPPAPPNFIFQTGYRTFVFTAAATGNLTLGFGVVNGSDASFNSALLVDNLTAVPEPASLSLLSLGLLALRRKLRSTGYSCPSGSHAVPNLRHALGRPAHRGHCGGPAQAAQDARSAG